MSDAKAGLWACPECGDQVHMNDESEPWDCVECGVPMEHQQERKAVPKEELRELVESWREEAEDADTDLHGNARYTTLHEKANELSELL